MAIISIVYRRFISSSGLAGKKANVVHMSRAAFHLALCSRQLDALTSLAMAAPSTGTQLVAHNTTYYNGSHDTTLEKFLNSFSADGPSSSRKVEIFIPQDYFTTKDRRMIQIRRIIDLS
ncbi:hypothetical protein AVEN_219286-1 [Araneus ventricosus]|uniref:Uncharacterized protein n=1 Tax=Araneus ventricosus TaxID=182803 RepID=A0A4Y2UJU5_ARAVE|nr:hypothetical protein AVEN_219286-1 [Araneus ventricosus]